MHTNYFMQKCGEIKTRGNEINGKTCPLCGDTGWHFYADAERGGWSCKKCGEQGGLLGLRKLLGDAPTVSRFGSNKVYQAPKADVGKLVAARQGLARAAGFLASRGILGATADFFKIGYDRDRAAIVIPYYEGGRLVNIKYRSIEHKSFEKVPGCRSTIFNIDNVDKTQPIFIFEGEFDAVAAWQAGIKNAVSLPDGCSSIAALDSVCRKETPAFYVAVDNDYAGNLCAENIAKKLGHHRCKRLTFENYKDANDYLIAGASDSDFKACIERAEPMTRQDLLTGAQVHDRFLAELRNPAPVIYTGLEQLDGMMGGLRGGEVTVLSGYTGTGKSTLCIYLLFRLMLEGVPVLFISAELLVTEVYKKLCAMISGKPVDTYHNPILRQLYPDNIFTDEDADRCLSFFSEHPAYFWDGYGSLEAHQATNLIEDCAINYGVRVVLLDHLHFFLRTKTLEEQVFQIGNFTRELCRVSKDTKTHLFLISHPNREARPGEHVPMTAMKGGSDIEQNCSNYISILTNRAGGEDDNYAEMFLDKMRSDAGARGYLVLKFNKENLHYESTPYDRLSEIRTGSE